MPEPSENNSGQQDQHLLEAPTISLPKGGGAIRGIGEKFGANPVTGSGSFSVPIAVSPGRSGFGPQLSLSYDSGAGNGPFGLGWHLSLPSITRKTDKGIPRYFDTEESDVFILSGVEDLVPRLQENGQPETVPPRTVDGKTYSIVRYRPRIEGLFARIERWTNQDNPADSFWRSISKDNITTWYGRTSESRIFDPDDETRIFSWLICESHDDKGNVISYGFKEENSDSIDLSLVHERNRTDKSRSANRYLKRIRYGNHAPYFPQMVAGQPWPSLPGNDEWFFEVVFDFGEHHLDTPSPIDAGAWIHRNDPFSSYRSGFEVRTYRLCQRVLMFHHIPDISASEKGYDGLVRSTDFTYSYEEKPNKARDPIYSKIVEVTQNGYKWDVTNYLKKSMPPLEFEYTRTKIHEEVKEVDSRSMENLPEGLDGARYQWVDLDGEGLSGILTEQAGSWFYKRNVSALPVREDDGSFSIKARFEPLIQPARIPSLVTAGGGSHQFLDLAGDGQLDVVALDGPTPGFYERTTDEDWEPLRAFEALPNIDWKDPNLKFVDLNGDGHADVLITESEVFTWYPSLAEDGFAPAEKSYQPLDEEHGPRLVFADGTQSIYLADLSGDGLSDLARIRNGEVCYWPNLGYGRFGAKVTMDKSPWFDHSDQFDQKRIRLADIDGSGTTDILYLARDGVHLYFNQSGNSWSSRHTLGAFPKVDNLSSVMAVDLLGNGTACLVWSSPLPGNARSPMRYIDLMGGQKPHLLVKSSNNLGAETRVRYAPSTKFYLKDKLEGKPWITRIPFPVHVVEQVETFDWISKNRFTTHYAYHHGYFDGKEREFRGFGMVEQWDTEEFSTLNNSDQFPVGDNIDQASHVPPVHTKTWFHTGIYLGRNHVSDFFAGLLDTRDIGEYYREPAWRDNDDEAKKYLLDDTVLPDGLSLEEEYETCRALKGSMLRQEVYALDGSVTAEHPYTVTEQNFTIRRIQPRGNNPHGVFLAHPREAISYHYERNHDDPRVAHAMTLEVDDYGNVLKSLTIAYGRRAGRSPLQGDDKKKQEQLLITCTDNVVTHAIDKPVTDPSYDPDNYRTPLPAEIYTYEVTGYDLTGGNVRFSFDKFAENNFQALTTALTEIGYEQPTDYTKKQKRLIEHVRTLYRKDNLTALLPLREIEPMALPGESYKLAFTPELAKQTFVDSGKLSQAELDTVLANEGRYVHSEGDANWWILSGRIYFSPGPGDTAAQEQSYAQSHFYLPHRYRDPFHLDGAWNTETFVNYDAYDLLVLETRDTLGNRISAGTRKQDDSLDKHGIDYRVLQPWLMMDPNRNRTGVKFDALGLVVGTTVMGKPGDNPQQGDLLDASFEADLSDTDIGAFYDAADPHTLAPNLLKKASTRIIYDIDRFHKTHQAFPQEPEKWEPVFSSTLARETHISDPLPPGGLKIQISFSYSDGFGREIQKKIQAEPGPAPKRNAEGKIIVGVDGQPELTANSVSPRWVGSGCVIFNNKGKPVRQYEPFFSDTHQPDFDTKIGVSHILFYDLLERVVAAMHPNHSYEKVVFDPWQLTTFDVNDTVASNGTETGDPRTDPNIGCYVAEYFKTQPATWQTWHEQRITGAKGAQEKDAAEKAAKHANTPTRVHFDALGRTFLTFEHNRYERQGVTVDEQYPTLVKLDIEGNQREIVDAKGRIIIRYDYYMAGPERNDNGATPNRIHQSSMEAGERWILNDVAGNPIRSWDSRGHHFRTIYDRLRRPIGQYVTGEDSDLPDQRLRNQTVMFEQIEYGENQANDITLNLRTHVFKSYDGAGVVTNEEYDFKGNLLRNSRTLADDYKKLYDWGVNTVQPSWETFTSSTRYDALNRPAQQIAPHNPVANPLKVDVTQITFNEANLLETIHVWLAQNNEPTERLDPTTANHVVVNNINYDAKGQRELIQYGNSAETRYHYDRETFRLTNLKTKRTTDDNVLQDLSYSYDPTGNIMHIHDDAQQTIYFNGQVIEPHSDYIYNAIYRLIEAKGREHSGQATQPWSSYNDAARVNQTHPHDSQAMRNYTERYEYDAVGNFERFWHGAGNGAGTWQRTYSYDELSLIPEDRAANLKNNRLSKTTVGGPGLPTTNEPYVHDLRGNMLKMPHLHEMHWDFQDQLRMTQRQRINNDDAEGIQHEGERTYYVYDAAGQRVRKVGQRQNGNRKDERIYLGGFEIYRKYNSNGQAQKMERESLHIMDDKRRIALVETKTLDTTNIIDERNNDVVNQPIIRYQISNHLGSACFELDGDAKVISYEEYYPYGSTAYQAKNKSIKAAAKRYRYSGSGNPGSIGGGEPSSGFNKPGSLGNISPISYSWKVGGMSRRI